MNIIKKIWYKRKSVIFFWLISYIAMLLLPILISMVIYTHSIKTINNEIVRANGVILNQIQLGMDSRLSDVKTMGMQLALNEILHGIVYEQAPFNGQYYYSINMLTNNLKVFNSLYQFVDNCYIYLKNNQSVISSSSNIDAYDFYESYKSVETPTYEDWLAFVNMSHTNDFAPMTIAREAGEPAKSVCYIQSVPYGRQFSPGGAILIYIDENELLSALGDTDLENHSELLIIDEDNNIIASKGETKYDSFLKYESLIGYKGTTEAKFGENVKISFITSKVTGWKYVSITPTRIFFEKVEYVRNLTLFYLTLCLLFGSVLIFVFSRKSYSPIRNLMQTMELSEVKGSNELHAIKDAIIKNKNEKELMEKRLVKQNEALRLNAVHGLLKGRINTDGTTREHLDSLGLKFKSERFAVMLFYVEEYEELFRGGNDTNYDKLSLVQFIIKNIIEEMLGENHFAIVTEVDQIAVCLINLNNKDAGIESLAEIASDAQKFIADKFKIIFTISVSDVHSGISGIKDAYSQALTAMEYKMVAGTEKLLKYTEIVRDENEKAEKYFYPLEIELKLTNFVKSGDFVQARLTIDQIFAQNRFGVATPLYLVRCLQHDIVSTLIKALNQINLTELYTEDHEYVMNILQAQNIEETKKQLYAFIEEICRLVKEQAEDPGTALFKKIVSYVEEFYADPDLSVSSVANHLGMNLSYVSKYFSKQAGSGLLDYINKVRCNRAKPMIAETALSISEIAKQVGYQDTNSFIRIFKKYEGITPGNYRNQNNGLFKKKQK